MRKFIDIFIILQAMLELHLLCLLESRIEILWHCDYHIDQFLEASRLRIIAIAACNHS